MDNGPELTAAAMRDWCRFSDIDTAFIEPGSPWQNGYSESFNGRFRDEFLPTEQFNTLLEVQSLAEDWRTEYNTQTTPRSTRRTYPHPDHRPGTNQSVVGRGVSFGANTTHTMLVWPVSLGVRQVG
jgi:transposase InsO family protein